MTREVGNLSFIRRIFFSHSRTDEACCKIVETVADALHAIAHLMKFTNKE